MKRIHIKGKKRSKPRIISDNEFLISQKDARKRRRKDYEQTIKIEESESRSS